MKIRIENKGYMIFLGFPKLESIFIKSTSKIFIHNLIKGFFQSQEKMLHKNSIFRGKTN